MSVKVKIGGDSKGAEDALKKTRTGMKGLGAEGKKSGDSIAGGFIRAQIALSAASIAAKALGSAFSAVAVGAIRVGADMESFEVKLETLLGSSAAAEERLAKLFEIGSTTPFQLDQLVAAEVKLEAFGVTGDRARTAVMDLAAFMDGDLAGAADAVGRAFAGGAGAADILRDRGVLAMVELQAGIKPTELSLEEFRETLIDTLTDPNGKIAGGTEKLAKTFEGLVSNLQDEWFKFQKEIADAGAFDAAQAALIEILRLIDDNRAELGEAAAFISESIADGVALSLEILKRLPEIAHEASAVARIMSVVFAVSSMQKFVNFTPNMIGSLRAIKLSLGPLGIALIGLEAAYEAATLGSMAFEKQARSAEERSMRASKARIAQINAEIAAARQVENTLEVQVLLQGGRATEDQMIRIAAVNEQIGSLQSEQYAQGETLRIQEEHRADNAAAVAEALDAASKAAEEAAAALGGTDKAVSGIASSVEDIGDSPLFDAADVKRLTREIEKMAGVFDEEAAIAEERKEIQEQINALLAQKLISEDDAFRLESLLLISAGDRLDLEKELSAEKELQNRLAQEAADAEARRINNIGQGTQALSQGGSSFISSGVGAAGAWGALIMAAIGAAQRDEEGNLALISQNDEFQAEVQAFAANIGDLIIEATEQVPEHLAEAMKNTGPEIVENLILGLTEAGPELAPALVEAISEGLSDPDMGTELAGMLIQLLISAAGEVPYELIKSLKGEVHDMVRELFAYFTGLWGDGLRNALETFGRDIGAFLVDIIEDLTGLDIDGSDREESDDTAARASNKAGRTVSSSSADDGSQGQNVVVELIQNFDAERFGLAVDISQIAVVRRGQAVASRVNRAVGSIRSATAGGA